MDDEKSLINGGHCNGPRPRNYINRRSHPLQPIERDFVVRTAREGPGMVGASVRKFARSPSLQWLLGVVAAFLAIALAIVEYERFSLRSNARGVLFEMRPGTSWRRIDAEGIRQPETDSAAAADLEDADEVIGVVVGGRPRAYRLSALIEPRNHLVNDLVGGVPVSIAYCDQTDCVQAYTSPGRTTPLPILQGGLRDGEMILKIDGEYYEHRTGRRVDGLLDAALFPYPVVPWVRTTWGDWVRRHPRSDVYARAPAISPSTVPPQASP